MAAVSSVHLQDQIKIQDQSDDEQDPYSPNTRDTITPDFIEEAKQDRPIHTSSFSIHNVLKKERDSNSPENVFSTDKLLQNTPNYEDASRNSESVSPRLEDNERADISIDDASCCSDDTVLSVGNEALPSNYLHDKDQNNQGLTSFKHIQTHLNAISQLSQNLTINQPILLRPNPITPNPLMFLNQPLLFQNSLMNQVDLKSGLSRIGVPQNNLNINPNYMNYTRKNELNERRQSYSPKLQENESSRDFINQGCLKFSIDNILKADFGRRITDPLTKRKTLKARQYEVKANPVKEVQPPPKEVEARVPEVKAGDKGAIDLSKGDDSCSNASSTPGNYLSFSLFSSKKTKF
ncbi:jg6535 [Pararge aegeria aegeria]|uniref:Jg6535 protein n=1 Tax=Pararge aegeria aegeria TaxID=348720 RepID=A0A8S4SBA3_9NEOP|nr:jg6535 [Pararge aegeria aegeria]